jgi:predicted outer membrane protein
MFRLSRLWIAALVVAPALLVAQERRSVRDNQADRPGAQAERGFQSERPRAHAVNLDQHIIACLITENEGEIQLSKFAQDRAQNKEVKDFAEQMITDHAQFVGKLKQLQGGSEATGEDRGGRRGEEETPRVPVRRPGAQPGAADAAGERGGKHDIHLQIKKEIAERCLASTQRELEQKKGAEFDRCFMGVQKMAHMKMVDELAVLEKYASPQLQRTLAQGSQTARTHLTHAKTLAAKLEGASAETARRSTSENK